MDVSVSNLDKNTFSNIDDHNNVGLAHSINISGKEIAILNKGAFGYEILNWRRAPNFNGVSKDRNAQFNREWNLENDVIGKESLFSTGLTYQIDEFINSKFNFSQYQSEIGKRNRFTGQINSSTKYIPKFSSHFNRVNYNKSDFISMIFQANYYR